MTYFHRLRVDLPPVRPIRVLQIAFLKILPRIEAHARICFRHLRCPHRRADAVAECIGLCWKWFLRLAQRGKDGSEFASMLATYAVKQVRSGRRLTGQAKSKDAMNPNAQRQKGFTVGKLPDRSTLTGNPLAEALRDNTRSEVPDQVAFRLDFPAWLGTHSERNRRIAQAMMLGLATKELAKRFGISPSRVSQLRLEFHDDWQHFNGEGAAD